MNSAYSFFENFKMYNLYEREMEKQFLGGKYSIQCDSILYYNKDFGNERASNVCVKFRIIYNFITSTKKAPETQTLNDKDFAYLNYWLNSKSKNYKNGKNITFKEFQNIMDHTVDEFASVMFDGKLYDLGEDDFQNMKLLDYLHSNYFEIFTEISTLTKEKNISCFKHVNELLNTYKRGIIQCHIDNTNFCKALKFFKGEYDNIFFGKGSIAEKCTDQELLKLPTYEDVSLEEKKISVVGSILGPSFGTLFTMLILYKFTPIGQWIHSKIGKNIETQSKLYDENDESLLNVSDREHINFCENSYLMSYDSVVNS
ncbi:PIR Superfamily Protein [Plasmodium ovale curtisi]|uniref:PIR Superfamily Protein n=1 Tax=Plasmodium ovale curtisi TaxID=864141 RepID=A0A1A8WBC9_PLAOA|nr:PIR Superfamily Protein [Plasmodium ovale curtisi]